MYILDGKTPIAEPDMFKWGLWFKSNDRIVKKTDVGDAHVSTVFLGAEHGFCNDEPLLFETMIFGGPLDGEQWRYCTWEQAEQGHYEAVKQVKELMQ